METGLPVVGCPGSRMRMRRGSRAAWRQPRSAAGVGAPASRSPRPGRGWGSWPRALQSARGPGGAGAAGGIQESGRAAGAKGPLLVGKKPQAPGIPRWSPIQDPNQARPCLASEIRRDRAPSG